MGAPVARRTAAGSLAHGVRSGSPGRSSRSQLRVSVGLAPTSPVRRDATCPGEPTRSIRTARDRCRDATVRDDADEPSQTTRATAGPSDRPWHAVTWLVWALAGTTAVQLASSPVYVVIVIGIAWLVVGAYGLDGPFARAFPVLSLLGVVFARPARRADGAHDARRSRRAVHDAELHAARLARRLHGRRLDRAPDRAAGRQRGSRHRRRRSRCSRAFNAVASHYELVQVGPARVLRGRAGRRGGARVRPVDDHGRARRPRSRPGAHRVDASCGAGACVRQLVPVLESGLERAVTLAESMDSRGFAHGGAAPRERAAGWFGAASLLALGGGVRRPDRASDGRRGGRSASPG